MVDNRHVFRLGSGFCCGVSVTLYHEVPIDSTLFDPSIVGTTMDVGPGEAVEGRERHLLLESRANEVKIDTA